MTDDFEFADELQDEVDAAITEAIPFNPDIELRDQTDHEESYDAAPERFEPDEATEADPDRWDIVDGDLSFDHNIMEGFDEF